MGSVQLQGVGNAIMPLKQCCAGRWLFVLCCRLCVGLWNGLCVVLHRWKRVAAGASRPAVRMWC
jgi:hypothetical protein